ncbi:hypothetical protein [Stenotrophomonas sp. 364]|uniref:hypothetical protein n=1 Tax=Stenotrophomonas sp. 364 TaxID=2691571 RepID=UPI001316C047|nr:hypothetical protein [Stenotrophomonas sp. 364]QHB72927.1 hypothetical protein GQ674_17240 [Stenotrophomonas sp. 364]
MLRLKKTTTVAMPIKLRLPTENPDSFNEGTITAHVKILTKDEMKSLAEAETADAEYVDKLLVSVEGLGDEDGSPINGDAALEQMRRGPWSTFLQAAFLQAYFEQYGDARVKNSKTSRRP